jgi:thiosulfate dehydrogenase [quinone] large subunit
MIGLEWNLTFEAVWPANFRLRMLAAGVLSRHARQLPIAVKNSNENIKDPPAVASECCSGSGPVTEGRRGSEAKPEVASQQPGHWDYTLAFLVLRGWLAVRALATGLEKFGVYATVRKPLIDPKTGMEDPSGALVEVKTKVYALTNYTAMPPALRERLANEPLLPKFTFVPFEQLLGPALILTGLMLLLGLGTRVSLFVQGLLYIALTFGLILIRQDDGVAWLGIHVALVALALVLAKHNKFVLLHKW